MFSREEKSEINRLFWKKFKAFAGTHKDVEGNKIKWVNYPIGVKQLYVRLYADNTIARFSIDVQDKDDGIRELFWEQLLELKKVLEDEMSDKGEWEVKAYNDVGQPISRISWTLEGVDMFNKKHHKSIFEFLMKYLLRFDRFYATYGDILIALNK